ncbi:MAG: hypothetical protein ACRCX2_07930 [Paraclostridium sp.]
MKCEFLLCDGQCTLSEITNSACSVDGTCLKVDNFDISCEHYAEEDYPEICVECPDNHSCAVATALKN